MSEPSVFGSPCSSIAETHRPCSQSKPSTIEESLALTGKAGRNMRLVTPGRASATTSSAGGRRSARSDGVLADERDGNRAGERTPWHAMQRAAWEGAGDG